MRPPNTPGDILINVNSCLEDGSLFKKEFYTEANLFALSGATKIKKTGTDESVSFFVGGFERFTAPLCSPTDRIPPRLSYSFGYNNKIKDFDFWGTMYMNFRDVSMHVDDIIGVFGGEWLATVITTAPTVRGSGIIALKNPPKNDKWDYLESLLFESIDSVRSYGKRCVRARIGYDRKGSVGYFSFGCHPV